ncbi:unnamed protein product [Didymodactylos carnosus]|uniref:Uncharacterized protein n=1 Tax=Didymodactylos carnosus TaxID=1234261 RepID=A0A813V656_9BILA|nr:unnamed protein product [Didymodactylos carnosus]CAF1023797.1 unnamed protein product [Didymodactylos carnosus]CAF3622932.1 unnamed protein product [Didymodactylos carnosus]CAF3792289.1 unnamed protein product [Didymodactylos carnosus]
MVVLSTDVIIALVVIAVVIVLVLLTILICCLCRQCDRCALWTRRVQLARDEADTKRQIDESRRELEEQAREHRIAADNLRVKYNLNGHSSNAVVMS